MGMPGWAPLGFLFVTTVLCKSTGSLLMLAAGLSLIVAIRFAPDAGRLALTVVSLPAFVAMQAGGRSTARRFSRFVQDSGGWLGRAVLVTGLLMLLVLAPAYTISRALGVWNGYTLVNLAQRFINEDRAQSLEVRIVNEDQLTTKAAEKRLFGWGGWGRWRVTDESGEDISATDGQWVITLGSTGVVGLGSMLLWLSLPLGLLLWRCPPRFWLDPAVAPLAVLAVIVQLFLLDNLLNAMLNPFWTVAAGAVCAVAGSPRPRPVTHAAESEVEPADAEPTMAGAQATP
jgi:hypothetical protein